MRNETESDPDPEQSIPDYISPAKRPLSGYQLACLQAVGYCTGEGDGPPSGADVKRTLTARYTDTNSSPGRLYPNLDRLVLGGYLTKGTQTGRANAYGLTDKAVDVLEALIAETGQALASVDPGEDTSLPTDPRSTTCPFCEETVTTLPGHLPCDESETEVFEG